MKCNNHFTFEYIVVACESSVFFVVTGLIAEALLLLFFVCSAV